MNKRGGGIYSVLFLFICGVCVILTTGCVPIFGAWGWRPLEEDDGGGGYRPPELVWSADVDPIGTTNSNSEPQVFFYGPKTAHVVWSSEDGAQNYLYSNHFADGTWDGEIEQRAYSNTASFPVPTSPRIFSNGIGTSFVVWRGGTNHAAIWALEITGESWSGDFELHTENVVSHGPQDVALKIGTDIEGFAVWLEGINGSVLARRYTPGSGWESTEDISTTSACINPKVAVDEEGNAIAVFVDSVGLMRANRFNTGLDLWGTAAFLSSDSVHPDWESLEIAAGPGKIAMVVWRRAIDDHIMARYYDGGSWLTPDIVDISGLAGEAPEMHFDPSGNAIAVWSEFDSIYVNRFLTGSTWPDWEGKLLLATSAPPSGMPQIAVDLFGNVFVLWTEMGKLLVKRFANGKDWADWVTTGEITTLDDTGNCVESDIAIDPEGRAIAVWQRSDGNIYSKRYFERE